jgi:hypothetical protein
MINSLTLLKKLPLLNQIQMHYVSFSRHLKEL